GRSLIYRPTRGCWRVALASHWRPSAGPGEFASSGSQTPVWEPLPPKLRFGHPKAAKPSFAIRAFPNRSLGTRGKHPGLAEETMRVTVDGWWHLGCATAACLAEAGNQVVGLDADAGVVADLKQGRPPLHEPGLAELVADGMAKGRLTFTADPA